MKKKINIMPMGGDGLRFKKYGYKNPKPLINIKGKPMFVWSSKSLPNLNRWIFIVPKKFQNNSLFKKNVKKYFKRCKIIYLRSKTKGQAITTLKANKYLKKNDQIFVNSCDTFFNYDKSKLKKKIKNK